MTAAARIANRAATYSPLVSLISTRIYPIRLPADPTLPAVTYTFVSAPVDPAQDSPGMEQPRVRFKAWTKTYIELDAIKVAIKGGFFGATSAFRGAVIDNSVEDYDEDTKRWWAVVDVLGWQPA